jgi:hypothetical protein
VWVCVGVGVCVCVCGRGRQANLCDWCIVTADEECCVNGQKNRQRHIHTHTHTHTHTHPHLTTRPNPTNRRGKTPLPHSTQRPKRGTNVRVVQHAVGVDELQVLAERLERVVLLIQDLLAHLCVLLCCFCALDGGENAATFSVHVTHVPSKDPWDVLRDRSIGGCPGRGYVSSQNTNTHANTHIHTHARARA